MKLLAIVLLAGVLSTGCGVLPDRVVGTARVTIQYATIKVIDGDLDRAARIKAIAGEVLALSDREPQVSADGLIGKVKEQIRWDRLDTADVVLVDMMLAAIYVELTARLGGGQYAEAKLTVHTLAEWVIDAADMAVMKRPRLRPPMPAPY